MIGTYINKINRNDWLFNNRHPPVAKGKRYLNSGLIIAYAADFYRLLTLRTIANDGNDQLHYQNIYIDDVLRQKLNIKLDHWSEMFQNLHQAFNDVELRFKGIFIHYDSNFCQY